MVDKASSVHLSFEITPQPDPATCGAAALHALYRFHGEAIPLEQVVSEVRHLPGGGTLTAWLGLHALRRGYHATVYSCDLHTFDPTWFRQGSPLILDRLRQQMERKTDPKLRTATKAYIRYLELGGEVLMEDITPQLISGLLHRGTPIIAGLSVTWLYRCARERAEDGVSDDVGGEATGHFVVIHGLEASSQLAHIADPLLHYPYPGCHAYTVGVDRLIRAILLGVLTFDAKLLVIRPPQMPERGP